MTDEYKNQLKILLKDLFQFDSADLDFGIYRIMNKKRDEIERFIKDDLIEAVNSEFEEYLESKGANLEDEIEAIKAEIHENLGEDALDDSGEINQIYVTTPFAKKLAERYDKARAAFKDANMSNQEEAEIFSNIYQFFSRYYDNGDFMSLRRYSQNEKYAIPYNGEEVVLHWANKDQYYIKTGEYFKNYSFKMGEYTVEFRILKAEDTTNNNKVKNRFFVLASNEPEYDVENMQVTIYFEYRGLNKDEKKIYGTRNVQDSIIGAIKEFIPSQVQEAGLRAALNRIDAETKRTKLEKHLRTYTKKNTTDYFIHKNLKEFLVRELDFYIKNEVFNLDDLGTDNEVSVEQYVSRVRVMKSICLKIIDFLAQIEDFQKMLFEKKKFVIRTDYCMTLDNVPKELYAEIVKNDEQLSEWNVLYGNGEEIQQTITSFGNESIDEVYLKDNPYLVLDTMFFDWEFKDKLLSAFDELDEATGGLMIKSENWQALNLMQEKYHEKVKCIYIDPPYNRGDDDGFQYKDNYQHSSWLTMMEDRIFLSNHLLTSDSVFNISIGPEELSNLYELVCSSFEEDNIISIVSRVTKRGGNAGNYFSPSIDYVLSFGKNKPLIENFKLPPPPSVLNSYNLEDEVGTYKWRNWYDSSLDLNRSINARYAINAPDGSIIIPPPGERWRMVETTFQDKFSNGEIEFREKDTPSGPHYDENSNLSKWSVWYKLRPNTEGSVPDNIFDDCLNSGGTLILNDLGIDFEFSKPVNLIKKINILMDQNKSNIILDFFAGSGTTAHAVLNLNKEDGGKRKYILVEMGDYFDPIMKRRIQKVMYSNDWRYGNPQSKDGISHIFKYQTLEQYEDTLNNIEFTELGTVQQTLADMDGYFLRYLLDFETRDSPCRFNVARLDHPFSYTLKINEQLKEQKVDLVETFNYLMGLHVRQIRTFTDNGTYYKVVFGTKDEDDIVVIWRDTEDLDLKEDKTFIEGTILSEFNPTKTYINALFNVEAHSIEPEFKKRMME